MSGLIIWTVTRVLLLLISCKVQHPSCRTPIPHVPSRSVFSVVEEPGLTSSGGGFSHYSSALRARPRSSIILDMRESWSRGPSPNSRLRDI